MHHDAIHYFVLFMIFVFIPGVLLSGIGTIIYYAREMYLDHTDAHRKARLRAHFRQSYRDWKIAEREGDYAGYIHRQNAEMFSQELTRRGA